MEQFLHEVPQEFTNEERWNIGAISLSRKSFIVFLVGLGVTYWLFKIGVVLRIPIVTVVIGALLTIVAVFITIFPVPESDYMKGGGLTLDIILFRRLVRRLNRVVYIKGISYSRKKVKKKIWFI